MNVNPDLLKPFVKVSIRDLVLNRIKSMQMVWIQGNILKINNDGDVELNDADDSVMINSCPNIQNLSCGKYYQVLGYYEEKRKVRAVKVVQVESQILQEMWPLEVQEMGTI